MKFLIFRDFLIVFPNFLNLFGFIFILKNLKKIFKSCADVVDDVAKHITYRHVVMYACATRHRVVIYARVMWRTRVYLYMHI